MADQHEVTDPDDPRLADFVALNDPARRRRLERAGDHFVVEGVLAIERLLGLPQWEVRQLALLPRVADRLAPLLAGRDVPVAVTSEAVLRTVVGFDLHRGALASVQRRPARGVRELIDPGRPALVVAAEGINDHENLGALYRNAAAFGAAAVALDATSADPFYRRSVRVSLGHVLAVPTAALGPIGDGVAELRALGATTVALAPRSARSLGDLAAADLRGGPVVLLVGAEGPGLTDAALAAADLQVAIPMAGGVDSLNVAAAAAVALFQLREVLGRSG